MFVFPPVRGTQLISNFIGVVVGDGAVGKVRRRERKHPSPVIFIDIFRRVFLYLIRPMHSPYVLRRTQRRADPDNYARESIYQLVCSSNRLTFCNPKLNELGFHSIR
jgi:hypothetical protein